MSQITQITPYLQYHAQELPIEQIYTQMQNFEQAMDDITVQGKIVDNVMNQQGQDANTDMAVDSMLQQMKTEQINEINADLNLGNRTLYTYK